MKCEDATTFQSRIKNQSGRVDGSKMAHSSQSTIRQQEMEVAHSTNTEVLSFFTLERKMKKQSSPRLVRHGTDPSQQT